MWYCHTRSGFLVMAVAAVALASASDFRSEQQRKEAIVQIERFGARVVLAANDPTEVRRIEISHITATREHELRNGRIISGDDLDLPTRFLHPDAIRLLAHFPEVEELSLWGTPVTDDQLAHLRPLENLRFLNLSGTKVTDKGLAHLEDLRSLEELILGDTFHYRQMGELKRNNGRNCRRIPGIRLTDQGLIHLKALPKLKSLNLRGTAVSDEGILHLQSVDSLRHLSVVETGITDRGLAHLHEHRMLNTVELVDTLPVGGYLVGAPRAVTKTHVTPSAVIELKNRLPRCLVVYGTWNATP